MYCFCTAKRSGSAFPSYDGCKDAADRTDTVPRTSKRARLEATTSLNQLYVDSGVKYISLRSVRSNETPALKMRFRLPRVSAASTIRLDP